MTANSSKNNHNNNYRKKKKKKLITRVKQSYSCLDVELQELLNANFVFVLFFGSML